MRNHLSPSRFKSVRSPRTAVLACAIGIVALGGSGTVRAAAPGKLGTYSGTINVTGTEVDPKVSYRAIVKVVLPITERDASSVTAEFLAGEAPNAMVSISQWDESHKEKSPDSGGQYNTWSCSLAQPVEVPMSTTGVLNVDLKKKKHSMSIVLLSTKEVAFNCTHSRSGPYKKKSGLALTLGTGAPGMQGETQLPFSDAARLSAKYTLMPNAETKGTYGPIIQEWDLQAGR